MHRSIARLTLFVILAALLAACGTGGTTPTTVPPTSAPGASASATPAAAAKPKGEITIWGWKESMDTIRNSGVLTDFQAEYPDVKVNIVEYKPADVYQKLPLALSAGSGGPDISLVENSRLAQFVELGGLMDLTDKVGPYVDKMNDYKWADATKDGKYYAMPWDSGPVVFYYRRDAFKAAGLPDDPEAVSQAVSTWDKYLELCKTLKEKGGSECFALNKAQNTGRLYEMMLWQQGIGYYNDAGEITIDSPQNVATLEKLAEFWKAGVVSDQLEWTDPWYAEMAAPDKPVASIIEASWMGVFLKSWIAKDTAGKWGVARMPAMAEGQVRAANDGGSAFVITEQSQNKEAAWAFLEFALGREASQVKLFKVSDFIPSLETTYSDPIFQEPDPFFGGQVARQTYADVVKEVPKAYIYGPEYSKMNGAVALAIQKVAAGDMSAADALKEAAETVRQQSELK